MSINKKVLSFIALTVCMFIVISGFNIAATTTNNDTKVYLGYDYQVKPGTDEWVELNSRSNRVSACQIPESTLQEMSTDDLIQSVLNYPFLIDMYAYDSLQQGFNVVKEGFNGLQELLKRNDAGVRLINKYNNTRVIDNVTKVNHNRFLDLSNLEIILSQDEIKNKLSKKDNEKLEKAFENKYLEKDEYPNIYNATKSTAYRVKAEKESSLTNVNIQSSTYVYTPKGSSVSVIISSETLTDSEKSSLDAQMQSSYPGIIVMRTATSKYNCHSYAWYSTSTSNTYWMNDPSLYMSDGSYTKRTSGYSIGDKIYYPLSGYEHSGVVTEKNPNSTTYPYITSKWGMCGLMRHAANNCPYFIGPIDLKYYYR